MSYSSGVLPLLASCPLSHLFFLIGSGHALVVDFSTRIQKLLLCLQSVDCLLLFPSRYDSGERNYRILLLKNCRLPGQQLL